MGSREINEGYASIVENDDLAGRGARGGRGKGNGGLKERAHECTEARFGVGVGVITESNLS